LEEKGYQVLRFWNNDVLVRGDGSFEYNPFIFDRRCPLTPALSPKRAREELGWMKALLLLAFGGPRSLDEVEFLLTRLFPGKKTFRRSG